MRRSLRYFLFFLFIFLSFNLYFLFLIPGTDHRYLIYLDFLILFFSFFFAGYEWFSIRRWQKLKLQLLKSTELMTPELDDFENRDIASHDLNIIHEQLNQQYALNCDLQDYIAAWTHEVKLPLSVLYLMNERIDDPQLKNNIREQLEKISLQLNMALVGCKVQSNLYDLQIKKTSLLDCVHASLKNQQFFLIRNHFQLEIDISDDIMVYTDKTWLVYVLDQLISNAIKYAGQSPYLKLYAQTKENRILLHILDHGEGIAVEDLPRIFEKGYTGHNHHNGQYKSTGMGLYLAKCMISRLGHQISVESVENKMTCFTICFQDQRDYFYL